MSILYNQTDFIGMLKGLILILDPEGLWKDLKAETRSFGDEVAVDLEG